MKTLSEFTQVVGSSFQAAHRVDLYSHAGQYVATLPVTSGRLRATARGGLSRWSGSLQLAGDEYAPLLATDYLSGLAGYHLRIYAGAVIGGVESLVEVARMLVGSTQVRRSADAVTVTVELLSVGAYVDQSADSDWTHTSGESCQAMMKRLVAAEKPPGWPTITWTDATSAVTVPTGATWEQVPAGQVCMDLAAIANVTVYMDALGNGVIRAPLSTSFTTAARTLGHGIDAVAYAHTVGRMSGQFANEVQLTFAPVGASARARLRADWTMSTSSGAPSTGQIRYTDSGSSGELRVHDKDSAGRNRQPRQLEKLAAGDIVEVRDGSGDYAIYTVTYNVDQTTYWQVGVDVLSYSTSQFLGAGTVELTAYFTPTDNTVGVATQSTGSTGTATAGRVVHRDYHVGNVTQTQANARAQSMLNVMLLGWSTTLLDAVPDYRLEPDDDVTVVYDDGVQLNHRVTGVDLPIGVSEPMTLALRTLGGT